MILPPHILRMLERLRATVTEHEATERLTSRAATPPTSLRPVREATPETVDSLWRRLDEGGLAKPLRMPRRSPMRRSIPPTSRISSGPSKCRWA
jgi:hypothetical protein